jgi:hypothetical protein
VDGEARQSVRQAVSGGRQAQTSCCCQSQPVERLPNITFLRQSISSRCSTYSWTNPSDRHVLAALTTAPNITGRRAGRPSRPGRGGASAAAAVPEAQPLLSLLLQRTGRLSELTGRVIGQRRARRMKRSDDWSSAIVGSPRTANDRRKGYRVVTVPALA